MPIDMNTKETQQRERFARRLANTKRLFVIAGETGLARVPSQKDPGREVVLAWTEREEAVRWADCLAENPRVKELGLGEVLAEFLPALAEHKRLVATDWTDEPVESETEPLVLSERIRIAAVDGFMERVVASGNVYILEDANGPALLVSATRDDRFVMPCWSQREVAEQRIEGPWANHMVMRIPVANFVRITLPWLTEHAHLCGPEHMPGSMGLELTPDTIARRIANGGASPLRKSSAA